MEKRDGIFRFETTIDLTHLTPVAFKTWPLKKLRTHGASEENGKCSKRWSLTHDPWLFFFSMRIELSLFICSQIYHRWRKKWSMNSGMPQGWTEILNQSFLSESRRVIVGFTAAGMNRVFTTIWLGNWPHIHSTWQLQRGIDQECKNFL